MMNNLATSHFVQVEPILTPARLERGATAPVHLKESFSWRKPLLALSRKVSFVDLLLAVYIAALVRQYLWGIGNNSLAWALTILLTLPLCGLHIAHREERPESSSRLVWLVVGLPLLFMFLLRVPFPDHNFDLLNYHLVNTERALHGWPFRPGDFFPGVLHVNPAPDMVDGIFRFVLGYRLGTIVNLLAVLWAAMIADKMLAAHVRNRWLRSVCLLFVVSTEYILYLLNLYMIDLLALPLLMEATRLSMRFAEVKRKNYTIVHIALFLGISVAFKLTNLAFAIPIALLCAWGVFTHRAEIKWRYVAASVVAFILPLVPFSVYMYIQTGSPVFPYYNKIFKSPYVAPTNYKDPEHGPENWWQALLWPVWSLAFPERLVMMSGMYCPYTGRIALGFVFSAMGLVSTYIKREVKTLCFITLLSALLWSFATGDMRYGLQLELLSGVTVILVLASLCAFAAQHTDTRLRRKVFVLILLFVVLMTWQTNSAYLYGLSHHERISDEALFDRTVQPTIFEDFRGYVRETHNLLSDRSPEKYFSAADRKMYDRVDVWINGHDTTSGVMVAINKDIPMLSVCPFLSLFDYYQSQGTKDELAARLNSLQGKRMYSLSSRGLLEESLNHITRTGLTIGQTTLVDVPFYSEYRPMHMVLIEVLPPGQGMGKDGIKPLVARLAPPMAKASL